MADEPEAGTVDSGPGGCDDDDDANDVGAVAGAVDARFSATVGSSVVAILECFPAGRLLGEPFPTATTAVESNSGPVNLSLYTEVFANFC